MSITDIVCIFESAPWPFNEPCIGGTLSVAIIALLVGLVWEYWPRRRKRR